MKTFIAYLVACIFLLSTSGMVFAQGKGNGHGHAGFGPVTGGAMPPGLQNKGLPPGLYKHGNKIPHGWLKGKKKGWHKNDTSILTPITSTDVTTKVHKTKKSKEIKD